MLGVECDARLRYDCSDRLARRAEGEDLLHNGRRASADDRDGDDGDGCAARDVRAAAEAEGVRLSLLSDYDLTGGGTALGGTLVLGYGSLADESCASVGETLKRACTAAWESSVRV